MTIPQNAIDAAQALGYPSTLFGFTPDHLAYWQEPGLPWLPDAQPLPLGYDGHALLPLGVRMGDNSMAPRFPHGCAVNVAPVYARQNLVIGRVYLHYQQDSDTGAWGAQVGRLLKIGGNVLWAQADNQPGQPQCWLLRDDERQALWGVYEVTHYLSYPGLNL